MLEYFMKKIHNRDENRNVFGFSLVELVVAMGILMLIMPSTVGIMKAATTYKEKSLQNNRNVVHSSAFNTIFRGDIENAVAIKIVPKSESGIPDGDYIKLKIVKRSSTGTTSYICKDWRKGAGEDGLLKSAKSSTSISKPSSTVWNTSTWSDIFDGSPTRAGSSGTIFNYENGVVKYNIELGKDGMVDDYKGIIAPKIAPMSSSPCW